jgi:hypothetical protein
MSVILKGIGASAVPPGMYLAGWSIGRRIAGQRAFAAMGRVKATG